MDSEILKLLNKQLEDRKKTLTEALVQGIAKDFAEYRNLCGEVRGLLVAQGYVEDLAKRIIAHEDA